MESVELNTLWPAWTLS